MQHYKNCVSVQQMMCLRWMCRASSAAGLLSPLSSLPAASLRPLSNVRDVASSLQHGAGGRSLMAIWGIYPTFCVYLCLSVRGSAADISKGIHLCSRRLQPPLWDQAHLAPNSGATCLRAKRRKTCSLHELWKRSWPTRRWKRLTIPNCAKPARWH